MEEEEGGVDNAIVSDNLPISRPMLRDMLQGLEEDVVGSVGMGGSF